MGVTNFPDGVNIGSEGGATALWQLGGTSVNVTADELNAIAVAGGLSGAELDVLDGAVAGTVVASKAVVVDANKTIDLITVTSGTVTTLTSTTATITTDNITNLVLGGSTVTATAAELNLIDGSTAGTVVASKAVVVDGSKKIDTIDITTPLIGGSTVTATAAEINKLDGVLGNALAHDASAFQIVASGSTAITGAGTVDTGLAGGAVGQIVASIANAGTIAATADAAVVYARPTGSAGSVIFECYDYAGAAASNAGTVHWIAIGTAA